MTRTHIATSILSALAAALACSGHTITSAKDDGGGPAVSNASGGAISAGGGSGSSGRLGTGGAPSADTGNVNCTGTSPATFPTFDQSCTNDASCVVVHHTTSCCGSQSFMAINQAELTRFQTAEATCGAQYPPCGCPPAATVDTEDGTKVPWGSESLIVGSCDNGTCRSHYSGKCAAP